MADELVEAAHLADGVMAPPERKRWRMHNGAMGLFSRKETTKVAQVSTRPRYVDADVQRVDVTVKDVNGESAVLELTLDQVRKLISDLTIDYSACRPSLLSQKEAERIATRLGMR